MCERLLKRRAELVDENAVQEIEASSQFHVTLFEVGESEALEVHEGEF